MTSSLKDSSLFKPFKSEKIELKNKFVMGPMTRSRANNEGVPADYTKEYYVQRGKFAGLIITEGTQPSYQGQGYPRTPGIHTDEQLKSWKGIVDGVHKVDGKIAIQIMHAGRIASKYNRPSTIRDLPIHQTVGPSAVQANGKMYTDEKGMVDFDVPKELSENDIKAVIADLALSAKNAIVAGFDAVEFHGANGYLGQQFLSSNANIRTDKYGGSFEGRTQFIVEVLTAMIAAVGGDSNKIGIKLSPGGSFNDIVEKDSKELYKTLIERITPLNIGFIEVADYTKEYFTLIRNWGFKGIIIGNGGLTGETANELLNNGKIDLAEFASSFISNPDLPERIKNGIELTKPDASLFYQGGEKGYIDYPITSNNKL